MTMKKEIIPKDTRYTPLTQQRWCCVPTCIQIVMLKNKIPLIPAELIGYHMGLTVPKKDLKYFWNAITGPKPKAGYGTRAGEKKYNPNVMMKKLKIPFKFGGRFIDKFSGPEEFKKYLIKAEKKNKDILVCFDWGKLTGEKYTGGHVCVFDRYYPQKDEMRIIDPEYYSPKWRIIKVKRMYDAMKFHGASNSAGFWELIKI